MRHRGRVAVLVAGALCWLIAQAVWIAAWRGQVIPGERDGALDEALELAGATLIAVGLLAERKALHGEEEGSPSGRWLV
jgi:hypothetical protein